MHKHTLERVTPIHNEYSMYNCDNSKSDCKCHLDEVSLYMVKCTNIHRGKHTPMT